MCEIPIPAESDCKIPVSVASEENVVRAVWSHHLDGNSLKKGFLRSERTSVMRHTYMGTEECRSRGRSIPHGNPGVRYKGLAIIRVGRIRQVGSDVLDSREQFCGHAHISHGPALAGQAAEPGEPLFDDPNLLMTLDERLKELKKATRYFPDPNPSHNNWTGEVLQPPAD
jgi:hypothetical protein